MLITYLLLFLSSALFENSVNGHRLSGLCSEGTNGAEPYPVLYNLYYTCENGDATVYACKPGWYFDPLLSQCNSLELTSSYLKHCPKSAGVLPHPQNCTQFIKCDDDNTRLENCEPETVFNIEKSSCDDIRNVPACNKLIGNENLRSDVDGLLQKFTPVHIPKFIEDRRLISKKINSNETVTNNNLVDSTQLHRQKRNAISKKRTLDDYGIVNKLVIRPRNSIKAGKSSFTYTHNSNSKRRKKKNNNMIHDSIKDINLPPQKNNTLMTELDAFKRFFTEESIDIMSIIQENLNQKTPLTVPKEQSNTIFHVLDDVEESRIKTDNEDEDYSLDLTEMDISYLLRIAPYSISTVGRNKTDNVITTERTTIHSQNTTVTTLSSTLLERKFEPEEKKNNRTNFPMETGRSYHGDAETVEVLSGQMETSTETVMDTITISTISNIEINNASLENSDVTVIPSIETRLLSSTFGTIQGHETLSTTSDISNNEDITSSISQNGVTPLAEDIINDNIVTTKMENSSPTSEEDENIKISSMPIETHILISEDSSSVPIINNIVTSSSTQKDVEIDTDFSALTESSTSPSATTQRDDAAPKTNGTVESQSHDILSSTSPTSQIFNNKDKASAIS